MASSLAPELCTPTGPGLHKPAGSPGEGAHLRPRGRLQGPWVRDQGGTETSSLGCPDVAALQVGGAGPPRGAWARRTVGPLSAVAGSSLQTLTSHPLAALTPLTHVLLFTRYRPARGVRACSWGPRPLVGSAPACGGRVERGLSSGSVLHRRGQRLARWPGRRVRPSERLALFRPQC